MCNPAFIAAGQAALSIGQQAVQFIGQKQQAHVARTYANLNYANRYNIVQQQSGQLDQEHSEKALDSAIVAAQAGGRISASSADLGYSGASLEQAINADLFGIGRQESADAVNERNARTQLGNELTGARIERASTIARNPGPSTAGLVLGIGKSVLDAGSSYASMTRGG